MWMQTITGRKVSLFGPSINEFSLEDIAHHLSMQCRFAGAVGRFVSNAEHAVTLATYVEHLGLGETAVRAAFLRNAHEAYIGNIITPLKPLLPTIEQVERGLRGRIFEYFGNAQVDFRTWGIIGEVKLRLTLDERNQHVGEPPEPWTYERLGPLGVTVAGMSPAKARELYLATALRIGISDRPAPVFPGPVDALEPV